MFTMSATPRGLVSAACSRCGSAAWAQYNSPSTLSSTIRCHSVRGAPAAGPSSITPALLTSVSSRPSSATVRSMVSAACCSPVTSASSTRAVPPSARMVAARESRRSLRRAATATAAPCPARASAVASPIPLDAPVTRATVPSSRCAIRFPQDSAASPPRAGSEHLKGVADIGEAVLAREPVGPPLDRRSLHLDRGATRAADQVVMVRPSAQPVQLLAAGQPHRVDLAGVHEELQGAVHRGQSDLRTPLAQVDVQLLGRAEIVQLLQQCEHLSALACVAGAGGGGLSHDGKCT